MGPHSGGPTSPKGYHFKSRPDALLPTLPCLDASPLAQSLSISLPPRSVSSPLAGFPIQGYDSSASPRTHDFRSNGWQPRVGVDATPRDGGWQGRSEEDTSFVGQPMMQRGVLPSIDSLLNAPVRERPVADAHSGSKSRGFVGPQGNTYQHNLLKRGFDTLLQGSISSDGPFKSFSKPSDGRRFGSPLTWEQEKTRAWGGARTDLQYGGLQREFLSADRAWHSPRGFSGDFEASSRGFHERNEYQFSSSGLQQYYPK